MNKVILVGRLARDPEVRYTQSGKATASFALAVNRFGGGGQNNTADFIPIVAWEKLAEICGNNLIKGSQILVEGRIQIRNYEDKTGQKRYVTEVIAQNIEFLGSKQARTEDGYGASATGGANSFGSEVFPDEEIPF
ncbi:MULTISPECIES: single-stranded DNA-binding protein [Anaerosinus]|uniref:Single-stranded DNA-binding protein n=1 Tax=Selenobaculum gibii TaxID=3054208 RepID=A0A9Y2AIM8_9FIRM|nr:single-stranded DNA-binding protein [Selenobaculum gbiensis]WIW70688.1 single-stranded DNA-binding protein [Selenobaculum gbiensis]